MNHIVNKWGFIFLVCFGFLNSSLAQKQNEELQAQTWFYKGNLGDDSLLLKGENSGSPIWELKFLTSGQINLKNLKKNTNDTSYHFNFEKKILTLRLNRKDSVKTISYGIKKSQKEKAYYLKLSQSSIYKKRKGDDTIVMRQLTLVKDKQIRVINFQEDLTIFGQKKGLRHDSVDFAVWGQFVGYISDTILIDSDQFVKHNFYKKYPDSMHYYSPLLFDTVIRIKLPIKEITGIYKEREPFSTVMTRITVSGIGLGLVCMVGSLVSGETHAANVFAQVATASFLTVPVSFGLGLGFSKQKFRLHGGKDPKKLWRIDRHIPNPTIKNTDSRKNNQEKTTKK